MVRVPHHDAEHGGSIFLTTLSLSMGRRVRTVSLSNRSNRRPINVGSGLTRKDEGFDHHGNGARGLNQGTDINVIKLTEIDPID